ncbi:hypothetical protein Tco_0905509 [Tanacetum coccineum]
MGRCSRTVVVLRTRESEALLVEEFCPSNEMEKLENEFWNHTMIGANHVAYTDMFHELAKLVPHLVTPESSRIKRTLGVVLECLSGLHWSHVLISITSVLQLTEQDNSEFNLMVATFLSVLNKSQQLLRICDFFRFIETSCRDGSDWRFDGVVEQRHRRLDD